MGLAPQIKAIETLYNGYRFRSRLEARWAVFFDTLGVRYEYEPEGYSIGRVRYLPDFKLVDMNLFLEIKGESMLASDRRKTILFAQHIKSGFYVIQGSPYAIKRNTEYKVFSLLRNDFREDRDRLTDCPFCHRLGFRSINRDCNYGTPESSIYCSNCDRGECDSSLANDGAYFHKGDICTSDDSYFLHSPRLKAAYAASRQARFEHGESGGRERQ